MSNTKQQRGDSTIAPTTSSSTVVVPQKVHVMGQSTLGGDGRTLCHYLVDELGFSRSEEFSRADVIVPSLQKNPKLEEHSLCDYLRRARAMAGSKGKTVKVTKIPGIFNLCEKVRFHKLLQVLQPLLLEENLDLRVPATYILPEERSLVKEAYRQHNEDQILQEMSGINNSSSEQNPQNGVDITPRSNASGGGTSASKNSTPRTNSQHQENKVTPRSCGKSRKPVFILKPEYGTQGNGIVMVRSVQEFNTQVQKHPDLQSGKRKMVAQQYIGNPLLLDGYKFDLRLYLVITEVAPEVKGELFREGLARFCTNKWRGVSHIDDRSNPNESSHLTNYSLNKKSEKFEDGTTKRLLSVALKQLSDKYPKFSEEKFWEQMSFK